MTILITGGLGFIGAHVAQALAARGDTVVLFDDLNGWLYPRSLKEARRDVQLAQVPVTVVEGSVLDADALAKVLAEHDIEAVLHLAAYANPGRSMQAAELYTEVNVLGTLNVLRAAQEQGVQRVVFAGSSSVYNDEQTPFKEDSYPLRPRSPYGASKAAAEVYCRLWHDLYGLPVTVLRFFSVYGPWGRPDMAPFVFAERVLTEKPIEVTREPRERDFTYIGDAVPAILAALDTDLGFEVINVGRGEPVAVRDMLTTIEQITGRTAHVTEREAPAGEMRVTYADVSQARNLLGYEPRVSVEEGMQELVQWLKEWYLQHGAKQS